MIKTKIMATISFAITVHNEHKELDKLLQQLVKSIREEDEIVVQMDITATEEVKAVVNSYKLTNYFHPLNKDFATFKNNLKSLCTKDWIFFIDADETLNYYFSKNIHEFLELNKGIVDLIGVPRVNKVNGLTYSEIADDLNISVKTVENQIGKAYRKLRKLMAGKMSEIN